eukprot:CAMPEP_0194042366 /NCGR_PEP_ID=MMETSP0009_2-20130614/14148_1 /TAXON_ID=210454 /ORGANISM="Grammatophora oceanica, Strain CCMP 410" /LENGTH=381 /DNA_ID=CAMNT_0038686193 /DNA_START=329 /DNA_END=1474 /DNA_ORIENTATION=+
MGLNDNGKKNEAVDSHPTVMKKKGGLQIKLHKKRKKRKLTTSSCVRRGPVGSHSLRSPATSSPEERSTAVAGNATRQENEGDWGQELDELQELPCDTALTMKHVIDTRQCLYIPLLQQTNSNWLAPAVMNFQLHQKLEGRVVARDLNQMWKQNHKVVRLSSLTEDVVVWITSGIYVRALWDTHRHYSTEKSFSDTAAVTTWFSGEKALRTKRIIRSDDIAESWSAHIERSRSTALKEHRPLSKPGAAAPTKSLGAFKGMKQAQKEPMTSSPTVLRTKPVSIVIETLVKMRLLMPTAHQEDTYILWLPNFGIVLKELSDAQTRIRMQIQRSIYKEISVASLRQQSTPYNVSNKFVVDWMVARGKLELMRRPSGDFVRLGEDW